MRKFLLAAAAVVSVSPGLIGIASAQATYTVTPPPAPATRMPASTPEPGTVRMHLKGRLAFDTGIAGDSGYNPTDPATGNRKETPQTAGRP